MAARKRGKGGKFVKGSGKKGPKKHRATPAHSGNGGGMPIAALHKPKRVKERLARMHSSKATRAARAAQREHDEAAMAAKYS